MLDKLIQALVNSQNEAADDALLEGLDRGNEQEQSALLDALLQRQTLHGMTGLVERYDKLPESLQLKVLDEIHPLHAALRECSRSKHPRQRLAAIKLVALGRQGKLAYLLSENLYYPDEAVAAAATQSLVALARWASMTAKRLQSGPTGTGTPGVAPDDLIAYHELIEQRPDIEAAVGKAMEMHHARHGPELVRAALLLSDWAGSRTLGILQTVKHGGQTAMVRRLQQPPDSENVEAFLLAASHAQLRAHFGTAFSHIEQVPVLDALLRKTHWLKDFQLQLCVHQVSQGIWWNPELLAKDVGRRNPAEAARIGEWIGASGLHDEAQDDQLEMLRQHTAGDFDARLRLFRIAARRRKGASLRLLRSFLEDSDERLVRMAARELVRRRPPDLENMLLKLMTGASPSVRRVVGRAIGQYGFEQFWERYERLELSTRRQAGRAMLKILPDIAQRLGRRMSTGFIDQRLKAMQIVQELGVAEQLRDTLVDLTSHANAKVRSKAVSLLGDVQSVKPEVLLDRVLHDIDARVRANAIEALENKPNPDYVPLLATRARSSSNRERANAIKALHRMKVGVAGSQLVNMLRDERAEHRISGLWALRQIGWWQMLSEVARLAKEDDNLRVRRYAYTVLKKVAEILEADKINDKAAG